MKPIQHEDNDEVWSMGEKIRIFVQPDDTLSVQATEHVRERANEHYSYNKSIMDNFLCKINDINKVTN